ncbi:MAG: hypothetical protein LBL46_04745 [Rickettsiales bacterium]|jgi:hypothetical protein|nr:hypothetical protein [Rickettsiales bacterium]
MKKRIRERERFAFAENKRMEHKRGIFSYCRSLLFSAIGVANGAKLCYNAQGGVVNSSEWSFNDQQIFGANANFTIGEGCDNNKGCTKIALHGIGRCTSAATDYAPSDLLPLPYPDNANSHCFCQLTYPFRGPAVYYGVVSNVVGAYNNACNWSDHCANRCGGAAMGDPAFFNKLMGK